MAVRYRSVVDRIDIVIGIDHRLDHGRAKGCQCRRHRRGERIGRAYPLRRNAEVMRGRLAIILLLQLRAIERKLTLSSVTMPDRRTPLGVDVQIDQAHAA